MVKRRATRLRDRRGKSRIGCLITIMLLVVGSYYGFNLGAVYVRYWLFKEEIKTQARLAPSIDDATIRRRVRVKADQLGLPDEARQVTIRRTQRPREIVISTTYQEVIDLPFFHYTFTLTPEVRTPL